MYSSSNASLKFNSHKSLGYTECLYVNNKSAKQLIEEDLYATGSSS
jgi:hypothetical protein